MLRKLKFSIGFILLFTAVFFLFPGRGLAVEFEITDVKIDARLLENGDAMVKETFTYKFDGDFNGITRKLIPKKGSKITNLNAEEKGRKLKVEKDGDLYLIHRKGSDETVVINIYYNIKNAVHVYQDVGDFYWPFFDDRNEADYTNFTVTVYPPGETNEVIAYGTDEAFRTESVQPDGSVIFKLGEVPSGTNGDIRVAYDSALFPAAKKINQTMKNEIIGDRQELLDKAAAWEERREVIGDIGFVLIPAITFIFLFMITRDLIRRRLMKEEVRRSTPTDFFVPKEKMTIPATIYYTNGGQLSGEAMAAAFLDLVRRGVVRRTAEDRFRINGPVEHLQNHEQHLLTFLFETVGQNGEFSFSDLKSYTKDEKNHPTYYKNQMQWVKAVKKEVMESGVYEKKTVFRAILGTSSVILLPFLILFPVHDLFGLFLASFLLFLIFITFAIAYRLKSLEGWTIFREWTLLKEHLKNLPEKVWQALPEDNQMLVYLYALGTKSDRFVKNEDIHGYFELPPSRAAEHNNFGTAGMDTMLYIGPLAVTNFHNAESTTRSTVMSSDSSSSGSFSGGGGIGGGGGGSGAF